MSWESKLLETMRVASSDPMMRIVFGSASPADRTFVQDLRKANPHLDEDYLHFLSLTDGAQLWMYVFAGSGGSAFPSLQSLARRWKPNAVKLRAFPIGETPEGHCIAIVEDARVVQFDYRAQEPSDLIGLASSFGALLDDVFMGNSFFSLFDLPPEEVGENEWTAYLRNQGWLSPSALVPGETW